MAAFKVLSRVSQQNRTRRHQVASAVRAVLETPGHHDGNRHPSMLYLERTIVRSRGTHHVPHRPAIALGEYRGCQPTWAAAPCALLQRLLQLQRNFCQEFPSLAFV